MTSEREWECAKIWHCDYCSRSTQILLSINASPIHKTNHFTRPNVAKRRRIESNQYTILLCIVIDFMSTSTGIRRMKSRNWMVVQYSHWIHQYTQTFYDLSYPKQSIMVFEFGAIQTIWRKIKQNENGINGMSNCIEPLIY